MIDSVRLNSLEQKRFGLTASPLCSNRTSQRGLAHRDSLRAKIDEGLSHSRFGAVILSEALFAKHWPQRELNALVALLSRILVRFFCQYCTVSTNNRLLATRRYSLINFRLRPTEESNMWRWKLPMQYGNRAKLPETSRSVISELGTLPFTT
jgi:hypothetical protein